MELAGRGEEEVQEEVQSREEGRRESMRAENLGLGSEHWMTAAFARAFLGATCAESNSVKRETRLLFRKSSILTGSGPGTTAS